MVCTRPANPAAGGFLRGGSSCFLEIGIFSSHLIWLVRTRKIRKAAAAEGKTFDDIAAEHEARGVPFKFAERKGQKRQKGDGEAGHGKELPASIA